MEKGNDRDFSCPPGREAGLRWRSDSLGECPVFGPGWCQAWRVEEARVQVGRTPLAPGSSAGDQGEVTSWPAVGQGLVEGLWLGGGKMSIQASCPFLNWGDHLLSEW